MSEYSPPPWLISMQRFGPPPSYPHLKIPGLNAPLPESGNYGAIYKPLSPPRDLEAIPHWGDMVYEPSDSSGQESSEDEVETVIITHTEPDAA
jgi:splicing factor 3B subunit 2